MTDPRKGEQELAREPSEREKALRWVDDGWPVFDWYGSPDTNAERHAEWVATYGRDPIGMIRKALTDGAPAAPEPVVDDDAHETALSRGMDVAGLAAAAKAIAMNDGTVKSSPLSRHRAFARAGVRAYLSAAAPEAPKEEQTMECGECGQQIPFVHDCPGYNKREWPSSEVR